MPNPKPEEDVKLNIEQAHQPYKVIDLFNEIDSISDQEHVIDLLEQFAKCTAEQQDNLISTFNHQMDNL